MSCVFQKGDLILLIGGDGKRWLTVLGEGKFSTNKGTFELSQLIGKQPGSSIQTHLGERYFAFFPTPADLAMHAVKRETQITYPKEMGYILLRGGVVPGARVVEAGTGSGSSTIMFAGAVGESGKVFSYERRTEFHELAKRNLERAGLIQRVELKVKDIGGGFDETEVDFLFLDVREPWLYVKQAWEALAPGCPICILVPTTNQVSESLRALQAEPFADIEVCEILLRPYKPNPDRLRPEDRMVAHTAFLIFGRKVIAEQTQAE